MGRAVEALAADDRHQIHIASKVWPKRARGEQSDAENMVLGTWSRRTSSGRDEPLRRGPTPSKWSTTRLAASNRPGGGPRGRRRVDSRGAHAS